MSRARDVPGAGRPSCDGRYRVTQLGPRSAGDCSGLAAAYKHSTTSPPWGFAGSDVVECTHVQIQLHGFSCETRARCVRAQTATCQTGPMGEFVRTLKTSEAAAVLNVSPNTLRAWERRFGYPKPQRTAGKHLLYTHGEVAALRDALQEGLSISSAISRARESLSSDTSTLVGALQAFELDRADGAMEAALALRSVERSVQEVLLPSINEIGERHGFDSAPWAFAARWATDWLQRAQRMALYRRGGRADAARTTARILPDSAGEAHRVVLEVLDGRPRGVAAPADDNHIEQPDNSRQVRAS